MVQATHKILIVDDETVLARAIAKRLNRDAFESVVAGRLSEARDRLSDQTEAPNLVLLDLRLPDGDGLDLLREISARTEDAIPVIVLTAFGQVDSAVHAMKLGAVDYLRKPVDLDELVLVVARVLRSEDMRHRLAYSAERDSRAVEHPGLIGDSPPMTAVRDQIAAIGKIGGQGETAPTVLIQGETGTGKDIAARMVHGQGDGAGRPFIHVDCATLPNELIEAELFGHTRGAFTSATDARVGLIEAAEDGTVFLDEIGELPAPLQAKLLSVIERRHVRRVGAAKETPVAARFIAATNRDLSAAVSAGAFRADLFFRLNVLTLSMPSLRDCEGDAALLAQHFAALTSRRHGRAEPKFTAAALAAIGTYAWPGNVRELKHLIERAVLLDDDGFLCESDLTIDSTQAGSGPATTATADPLAGLTLDEAERILIARALERSRGNVSKAARMLGVTRMTLRYRIDKHQILAPEAEDAIG